MYKTDPNNAKKQVPKARSVDAYGQVSAPAISTVTKRPNYVLINASGSYAFCYKVTGSVANINLYVTGAFLDDAAGPVRLDIQPNAWRKTDGTGTVGNVTFVYTGDIG
tara:strand:+ start:198 stop:521 length:324 start_codon:yes stop_codon:yes gene_type:complete